MSPRLKTNEIASKKFLCTGAKTFETDVTLFILFITAFILGHGFQFIQYLLSTYFVFMTELGTEILQS